MISTLYLVVWSSMTVAGTTGGIVPAKSLPEVCAIQRRHSYSIVYKVTTIGPWEDEAEMRHVLVECE